MTPAETNLSSRGPAEPSALEKRPRIPLHVKILLGLLVGTILGLIANALWTRATSTISEAFPDADANGVHDRLDWFVVNLAYPVGRIFLRLLFMVVVPLIISALTLGVMGFGDVRRLGRIGLRTLLLTVVLSGLSVVIGVSLVNVFKPGAGLDPQRKDELRALYAGSAGTMVTQAGEAKPIRDTLLDMIPENPLQEMVGALDGSSKGNGMLAVMFFCLVMGAALSTVSEEKVRPLVQALEAIFDACMAIIGFTMRLAPVAVACLVFTVTARLGGDVVVTLLWFILTVLIGLTIHMVIVYTFVIRTLAGRSPLEFFRAVTEAMVTAFATSSSNASLPTSLRVADRNLGLRREISHFVLTVGATANQNGTALYEGVVVLFLAQVFGVDLNVTQQVTVVLMSVLAGVGTAGVPGGSLPLIVVVLQTVGVPGEGIAIILGVDRILDMARTVVNVVGDLTIAACVDHWELRSAKSTAAASVHT